MIPGSANPLLLVQQDTGYKVQRSLRFNSSDSGYLSRTPASAGNRKTWTWAAWVKRSTLSSGVLFGTYSASNDSSAIAIRISNDKIDLCYWSNTLVVTDAVYRDPSAWYHVVIAVDTTQATAANRIKIYVNGTQQTLSSGYWGYPSQNADLAINQAALHSIGSWEPSGTTGNPYFSGYLADIHFIDGQALTPSSFAETNATTGQWVPKLFSGSYGTNGFKLNFSDNSNNTATTLGKDTSGNSNNWTPNNLSVTAGAGNDSLVDTPTSYGTDTGAGGEVRGNYATLNPLDQKNANTLSNGNLDCVLAGSGEVYGTQGVSSGKWYFEIVGTATADSQGRYAVNAGVANLALTQSSRAGSGSWMYYTFSGEKYSNGSYSAYGNQVALNDVLGVAVDLDNSKIWFSKNGTWQNSGNPATGANAAFTNVSGTIAPAVFNGSSNSTNTFVINTGTRAFAYTAPSGFKALCDTNLPAPVVAKPSTVMDIQLWTGNGSAGRAITGYGFSPDLVWIKSRSAAYSHALFDTVRGVQLGLQSNATSAEASDSDALTAFNSNGFTVGTGNTIFGVNTSSQTFVGWCWDAGDVAAASNNSGSITSTVKVNATSGFSIIGYTGTSSNATVGHGLGVVPGLLICKSRTQSGGSNWVVWHSSFTGLEFLRLNTTDSKQSASVVFNSTTPTSSVISLGTDAAVNGSGNTHIIYAFAPVSGYSSGFSYTGNGSSDGPMVWLGFRPRFLLIKASSFAENWTIIDTARDTYNASGLVLEPNLSDAEVDWKSSFPIDILSNGFKLRNTGDRTNRSAATYVGYAFAESPFAYSRAR